MVERKFERISKRHFGNKKYGKHLADIMESQNWECPYSGEKLILGVNTHLDHIKPKSKHNHLARDLSNLQWTTRVVNVMKQDLEEDDFLDIIAKIYNKRGRK